MDNPSDAELQAALQAYRENIDDHGRAKAMLCALIAAAQVRAKTHVSVRDRKHAFEPDPKYPWFCAKCGYGFSTDVIHLSASGGNRD